MKGTLFILFIISIMTGFSQDTISYPDLRYGVHLDYRLIYDGTIHEINKGDGYSIGGFIEKRVLQRIHILSGIGTQYSSNSYNYNSGIDYISGDTTYIRYKGDLKYESIDLIFPLSLNFYYLDSPKLYLSAGMEWIISIDEKNKWTYKSTNYVGERNFLIGTEIEENNTYAVNEIINKRNRFGVFIGLGLGIKKINIDLNFKLQDTLIRSRKEFSLSVKYQLGHKHRKKYRKPKVEDKTKNKKLIKPGN